MLREEEGDTGGPDCEPYGDPTQFTGQPLNSGVFLPGATFTAKGTYQYHCALHDYLHMVGTVIVD